MDYVYLLMLFLFQSSVLLEVQLESGSKTYEDQLETLKSKDIFSIKDRSNEKIEIKSILCKYPNVGNKKIKIGEILYNKMFMVREVNPPEFVAPLTSNDLSNIQCVDDDNYDNCVFPENFFPLSIFGEHLVLEFYGVAKKGFKLNLLPGNISSLSVFKYKEEEGLFFKSIYCLCSGSDNSITCSISKDGIYEPHLNFNAIFKKGKVTFGEDVLVTYGNYKNIQGDSVFVDTDRLNDLKIKCKEGKLIYRSETGYKESDDEKISKEVVKTKVHLGDMSYYKAKLACVAEGEFIRKFCKLTSEIALHFCGIEIDYSGRIPVEDFWEGINSPNNTQNSQNSKCILICKINAFGIYFGQSYSEYPKETPTFEIKESPSNKQFLVASCKKKNSAFKKEVLRSQSGSKGNSIEFKKRETFMSLDMEFLECAEFCRLEKILKAENKLIFVKQHVTTDKNEPGGSLKLLYDGEASEISCKGKMKSENTFYALCEEGTLSFYSGRGFRRKLSASEVCG